jgi:FAD/FMN-containing dehydrogenase
MDYISDVAMTPFASDAVYVNLLAEDEPGRIPSAYGTNLDRLKELKRKWDPHNRFHGNQNIAP